MLAKHNNYPDHVIMAVPKPRLLNTGADRDRRSRIIRQIVSRKQIHLLRTLLLTKKTISATQLNASSPYAARVKLTHGGNISGTNLSIANEIQTHQVSRRLAFL